MSLFIKNAKKIKSNTCGSRQMREDSHLARRSSQIKFDCRDRKIYLIIAVVVSLWLLFDFLIIRTSVTDWLLESDAIPIFACTTFYSLILLVPASWLRFFDVCLYLRSLKAYGYEVPKDSRVYDKRLEQLPRTQQQQKQNINDGVLNTIISAIITVGILYYNIWFLFEYQWMFLCLFNLIGLGIWMIVTFHYVRQISNVRYKDRVELDDSRKTRESLMEAMMGVFCLLLFSLLAIEGITSMAHIVTKQI